MPVITFEDWLDTPQTEDETITNRFMIDSLYSLLLKFYEDNNLVIEEPRMYQDFCRLVYDNSRS